MIGQSFPSLRQGADDGRSGRAERPRPSCCGASSEREARLFQGRTQRTSCVQTPTPGNSGLHSVVLTEAGLRVVPRTAG